MLKMLVLRVGYVWCHEYEPEADWEIVSNDESDDGLKHNNLQTKPFPGPFYSSVLLL